jgi:hypothetical protein
MNCPKCSGGEIFKVETATVYYRYSIGDDFEGDECQADEDWGDQFFDHYECDGCGATWDDRSEIIDDINNNK